MEFIRNKTSLNEPTINDPLREVVGFGSYNIVTMVWVIAWDPNKVIDIGQWSICGGGRLERLTVNMCILYHIIYNKCNISYTIYIISHISHDIIYSIYYVK